MRTVEVSTSVFAKIWALREEGEESEDAILGRVLSGLDGAVGMAPQSHHASTQDKPYMDRGPRTWNKPTWATDIAEVLERRGKTARLNDIYNDVRRLRKAAGRTCPPSLQATVRRTLENHSSDSDNYTGGADLFCMPEGKRAGVWQLR